MTRGINQAIQTAYDWHGGQSSPMYSFASTRTIHNEEHWASLNAEIDTCLRTTDDDTERDRLRAFRKMIRRVDIGKVL